MYFIRNDEGTDTEFDYSVPEVSQQVLAWLIQPIEVFVYCVLGTQVNVRSSIIGDMGDAKEAQREILAPLEDAGDKRIEIHQLVR